MLNNKKVVAVVPIKLISKRLKGKNLRILANGKTLLNSILATLLEICEIDEIYVYCSNPKIRKDLPQNVRFLQRDQILDSDETSMNQILDSFIKEIQSDIYILTHATSPLLKSKTILNALKKVANEKYDSSFSVAKENSFLWLSNKTKLYDLNGNPIVKIKNTLINYNLEKIPRTQDIEGFHRETSNFYIFNRDVFQNYKSRIGKNPYLALISKIESVDIDDFEDFLIADSIIKSQL